MKYERCEWLALLLILLLAAGLRLARLDLVEFKYDEAHLAAYSLDVVSGEHYHLRGLGSSVGAANPPFAVWVFAIPYTFSRNPLVATGFVACLGVLAVAGTYLLARRWVGIGAALIAALLFSASPWAVTYARKIWAQDLLPPFTVLFLLACVHAFLRQRPLHLILAFLWASCMLQIHLSGTAFMVLLVVFVFVFRWQVRWQALLGSVAVVGLSFVPYLVGQVQSDWIDVRVFLETLMSGVTFTLDAPQYALLIVGGRGLHAMAGAAYEAFLAQLPLGYWPDRVEEALLVVALGFLAWRTARDWNAANSEAHDRARLALMLLLTWVVPVAFHLLHSTPVYPHYFILLYPSLFWAIGWMLQDAVGWIETRGEAGSSSVRRWAVAGVILALLALVGWQVYLQQAFLSFVDTHDTPGGYGAPVKYTLAAARRAEELKAETTDAELIALLPGADPEYDGQATVFDILLRQDRRLVDGRQGLVLPPTPAVYLTDPEAKPGQIVLADLAVEVEPTLPLRGGSDASYRFFRWQPASVIPAHPREGDPVRWASGVALVGYDWSGEARPGGTVRWTLYWRIGSEPPAGSDVHWFNHLVDGAGARWGQMDGVGVPASMWRVGDIILTWFDIPIAADAPPPPYFVRSGMYTYPDVVNIALLDEAGNPAGEFVELGPIGAAP